MRTQEASLEIPSSNYLRSGEFTVLCRTTKETLRHYRQIGLIEPALVSDNGYAYYSPLQLGDFMLISALQRAGSSLADIGRYLESPQSEELEDILEEHIERLDAERKALHAQQKLLEKTLEQCRSLDSWKGAEEGWRVVYLDEERLFETDISDLFDNELAGTDHEQELVKQFVNEGMRLLEQGLTKQMQGSYRIGLSALLNGHPEQDFHFCFTSTSGVRGFTRHIKPKGRYFQRLQCVSINELLANEEQFFDGYVQLVDEVRERGFVPVGDLYEQELSLFTGDISEKTYAVLSIQIAE